MREVIDAREGCKVTATNGRAQVEEDRVDM